MAGARKALVVGIDHYDKISGLHGCVNDAHAVKAVLDRHMDGTVNFAVKLMTATGPADSLTRTQIKDALKELFNNDDNEVALFYFAGHGHIEVTGGYLCASDCSTGDDGLSLHEVVVLANKSKAKNKIIILDSCHSGVTGTSSTDETKSAELTEGLTILTASTAQQYATEENGAGVFTTLLVDALNGAAGNLVGDVTPGGVYAHIDQSLGPWDQRPVFKTNVKSFVSLRTVTPPIQLADLQRITELFPAPGFEFDLDPGYEPESSAPDVIKTAVFAILQKFNRVNLVVPVDAPHMYHAAMGSKTCKLTVLGEHYRRLVAKGLI
jgi:hypothetical protein